MKANSDLYPIEDQAELIRLRSIFLTVGSLLIYL